jgi:hypothetical protein
MLPIFQLIFITTLLSELAFNPLKLKLSYIIVKNAVSTAKKTEHVSITKGQLISAV